MTFEERLAAQLYLERRAHAETRRKLAKAEHDRDRYGRRIRFLQGRHEILAREYRAIRAERDTLDNCVTMLERRLLDEQPGEKRPTAQPVPDRFPLSGREYYALRELFGVVSTFNNCAGELDKRVRSIPEAYRDYRMIQSVAEKLVRKLLTTVPKNKLVQISKELKYTRIVVEVKPEITPSRDDGNLLTYVPQRALERIMEKVVGYECFCCEKAGKDARRCQLRRDIEATYHYDYPDDGKECPFAGMTIGGSCEKSKKMRTIPKRVTARISLSGCKCGAWKRCLHQHHC